MAGWVRQRGAGSMSRPALVRIEFVDGLKVIVGVELLARQGSILVAGLEERDRDHEGAGELEGVVLCEVEIGHGFEAPSEAGEFPLDGSSKGRPRSRSPHRRSQAAAAC